MEHGDIIGERYRLDRKIGQGGTGSIFLAQDARLDRQVAIKFLFANSPQHQERLAKRVALEAKIAASIQHRNVVQIFDFGTHAKNIPYIVMEALTGHTLGQAFDSSESFSLDNLIHLMSEVLRGLSTVHDAGIVHRDLKPENIFLIKEHGDKLSPKLLDFGISRSLEPDTRRSAVTTTEGLILGTPQYMSPEQARGLGNIDKRTDIYSVGIIMFEALSGFVPFDSENMGDLLIKVIRGKAPSLSHIVPQIGPALCNVVDKALAKNRDHRYLDAAEMHAALIAAAEHVPPELDRKASLFPPPAIRSRVQSKRSAFESEFSLHASEHASEPPDPTPVPRAADTVGDRGVRPQRRGDERTPASGGPRRQTPRQGDATLEAQRPAPPTKSALQRWLPGTLAAATLLSIAVTLGLAFMNRTHPERESGFIVVQASGQNGSDPNRQANSTPASANAPPSAPPSPELAVKSAERTKRPGPPRMKTRPKAADDPLQLKAVEMAQAFSRQKAKVISCLDEHPDDMEGAPQLTVRVSVDRTGKVSEAALLPDSISSKAVGGCVARAVISMNFPSQEQSTTFRIPLLWRRK